MRSIDFIKIALKDYKTIGAVTLSSKYAVRRIIKQLKPNHKYIVEYGAGNGVITREILKVIPSDGKVVAIELNNHLFKKLLEIKDRRLLSLHKNVVDVSRDFSSLGLPKIDAVISGIPFSFLKSLERKEVIKNTYAGLTDGGQFIVYQTSLLLLPLLKKFFKKTSYRLELRNIPPYFIMIGEK
ncbi:MAG: rRNA adenine N-6-methyltransferase family protein [Candidatus Taylorbacteria bacterium]|nr:rRNA adenine N-6-methyltransferase family protein [Candidatus Taylorbacteria bacterium]